MARKIMLTGACSQLGRIMKALLEVQPEVEVVALRRSELDILDAAAVMAAVENEKPAAIINCAGFNDVAAAESRLATKLPVNARGHFNLAKAAEQNRVYLCTFSSKFVFDGKKDSPYLEDDDFWPINQYGTSKQGGEEMIANLLENYLIVRSDLLYGGGGDDFVSRVQKELQAGNQLKVSDDFFMAPTYIGDLAAAMVALSSEWAAGVYHYTNDAGEGINSYEFAQAVAELSGLDGNLLEAVPVTETDFGEPLSMPKRAVLSIERFRGLFPSMVRPWRDALANYLQ